MRMLLSGLALGSSILLSPAVHAQIVIDGGFDAGLAAWTTFGAGGGQFAAIDGVATVQTAAAFVSPAGLRQSVTMAAAPQYFVAFDWSAATFTPGPMTFTATLGATQLFTFTAATPAQSSGGYFSGYFTGLSLGSQNLDFTVSGSGSGKIFTLDNVVVQNVPGPLPVLGAMAAFGWTRKLRRKIKEADSGAGSASTVGA